ncbi:serine incorporator/TMS membrane protein [Gymnopilus junonius]|uniref:Serine incorporator/TMS membrane protein n=1 Tax=Gymnopilus junonius TaxID=109634 RepID=A0A9P5NSA9_GYMJU|nr:serine incorporator/TMS membrane protein [Gymnopilus junonius]
MGLLLSLPLAGGLTSIATSCLAGLAFFCTSTAASMFFKSCNCNSSIATRVGFAIIFSLNSILAWMMKTDLAIKLIEKWSFDYIKMDCAGEKCYGVLAVHRICFALALLHFVLSALLIGVRDTKDKRAAIQNGWWGPKVLFWLVLVGVSFTIPNGFFMFWGNYVALIGATIFILLGLVLLVDFAHSWSETCLENWENSSSNLWQWVLIGSTLSMYAFTITLTGLLYAYFAGSGCNLNQFFISFNLALCIVITIMSVHPAVQERNPRSGLAQSAMVAAYCTYLVVSALSNHVHETKQCNPLRDGKTTQKAVLVMGGIFTFLAIAYSTTRAATQSRALVGKGKKGRIQLTDDEGHHSELGVVNTQPGRTESPRYQALLAAVEAGAIPASALQEEEEEEEDDDVIGESRDDELTGTRYNYSWFHVIFAIGSMYVAMLLTDWYVYGFFRRWTFCSSDPLSRNVVSKNPLPGSADPNFDVYIGRSEVAMWMRVVSGWVCILLYMWSLLAPVLLPDRFDDFQ